MAVYPCSGLKGIEGTKGEGTRWPDVLLYTNTLSCAIAAEMFNVSNCLRIIFTRGARVGPWIASFRFTLAARERASYRGRAHFPNSHWSCTRVPPSLLPWLFVINRGEPFPPAPGRLNLPQSRRRVLVELLLDVYRRSSRKV